jgi:ATP-dependent DNA helicase RecG
MVSLIKIVEKLEAPLLFAMDNACKRLPRIKNLETVMTSLLHRLKEELHGEPQLHHDEIDRLASALIELFDSFESLPLEQKQYRLTEAMGLISTLKALIANSKAITEEDRSSMLQRGEGHSLISQSVQSVRGVGPRVAQLLARKNLTTIEDLLYFLPRRYEDRRTVYRITETVPGIKQTVSGRITLADIRFYGRRKIFEVTVDDGHGILKAKWFKGREAFLRSTFKPEKRLILTGKISGFPFEREMIHPDFEIIDDNEDQLLHFKRIVPVF